MDETATFDRRTTPVRADLAAAHLRGRVPAPRYAEPKTMRVTAAIAPLTARPDRVAPLDSQLLHGETFSVYDIADGWAWGQGIADGYVGYVPAGCLGPAGDPPTHRVTIGQALVYAEPKVRLQPIGTLPMGARVRVRDLGLQFCALDGGGFVPTLHVCPVDSAAKDWVSVAHMFLGAPYLWGGRSAAGIDCSGLVQIARQAAGHTCPRDSDMQQAAPGTDVGESALQRGDLVFWKGHVGVLLAGGQLLHANGYHMAVAIEPLARAVERIERSGGGPVTALRRWTATP